jgi:amidase
MFLSDGGKSMAEMLEPVNEPYIKWLGSYKTARELGTHEMWQIQAERTELCKAYLDRWNACAGLDVLLCPTTPYAAVKHDGFTYVGYTGVFNILDYSALSFPTGIKADATLDVKDASKPPLGFFDEPVQGSCKIKMSSLSICILTDSDNAELVHGQPISLQLVSRRLEEEKLLSMAESIMRLL